MAKSHYPSGYSFKDQKKKKPSRFNKLLTLLCVVLVLTSGVSFFADQHWFADLFSHFALQYFLGGILLCFMLLLRGKRIIAIFSLAAAIAQAGVLTKAWDFEGYAEEEQLPLSGELVTDHLRIFHHNVFGHNRSKSQVVDEVLRLREEDEVDLVVLQEITPEWTPFIERLKDKFLYAQIEAKEDHFGYAVFSRVPTVRIEEVMLEAGYPLAIIRAYSRDQLIPFSVYMIHATPPMSERRWNRRNDTLFELAELVQADVKKQKEAGQTGNIIVSGDLNITPYSPWFGQFVEKSGLHYRQESLGDLGTWPHYMPTPLRIPIDHKLATSNIRFESRKLGESNGSDHMAVLTTFKIPSNKKKVEYREITDAPATKEIPAIEVAPKAVQQDFDAPSKVAPVELAPEVVDEPISKRFKPRMNNEAAILGPSYKPRQDLYDPMDDPSLAIINAFERESAADAAAIVPQAGGNAKPTAAAKRERRFEATGSKAIDDAIKAGLLPPDVLNRTSNRAVRSPGYVTDWDNLTKRYAPDGSY